MAEWSAGDVLQYYGTVLAAVGAAIGVYITVKTSIQSYRDDEINRVLPYIVISQQVETSNYNLSYDLLGKAKIDKNDNMNDIATTVEDLEPLYYEKRPFERAVVTINNKGIRYALDLSEEQIELLKHKGFGWEKANIGEVLKQRKYVSLPIKIENVGNGTAVNFRLGINRANDEKKYLSPIALNVGQIFELHVIIEDLPSEEIHYVLSMIYHDIFDNHYKQEFKLILKEKEVLLNHEAKQERVTSFYG